MYKPTEPNKKKNSFNVSHFKSVEKKIDKDSNRNKINPGQFKSNTKESKSALGSNKILPQINLRKSAGNWEKL